MGGVTPSGTIEITENGTYDVTQYANADVNVSFADLLWTNAYPSNEFAAQTVYIDLSEYRFLIIQCHHTISNDSILSAFIEVGQRAMIKGGTGFSEYRLASTSTAGITFTGGYIFYSYGGDETVHNGRLVPVKIYGIR